MIRKIIKIDEEKCTGLGTKAATCTLFFVYFYYFSYHFILKSIFNFYQSECHLFHSVKCLFQVLHAYGAGNSEMICAAIAKGNPRNDLYMAIVK